LAAVKISEAVGKKDFKGLKDKNLGKRNYETQCHIAALKYNNVKMLEAKWKPVANCNLLGT